MSRVLRCGPFASGGNNYRDEPESPSSAVLPVNAAKDNLSASWPWRHYERKSVGLGDTIGTLDEEYKDGFPSVSMDEEYSYTPPPVVEGEEGTSVGLEYWARFRCQANDDFQMSFTYDVSASTNSNSDGGDTSSSVGIEVYVDGGNPSFREYRDYDSDGSFTPGGDSDASINGVGTVTIPADGTPTFVWVKITATSYISYDEVPEVGTCYASISISSS